MSDKGSATPAAMGDGRDEEVTALLKGAVDIHCHSGPAAMPRILTHDEEMMEASASGFRAVVTKDHFYPGMSHCAVLNALYPDAGTTLFSGLALNNASGGINPHAVDHTIKMGGKIIWMPTLSAKNHLEKLATEGKSFPKTSQPMLDAIPLTVFDANGKLSDESKKILDLVAEGDIILSGGHLRVDEQFALFEEGKKRGLKKMVSTHPTYMIGCSDEDLKQLASMGVYLEHVIGMFLPGRKWGPEEFARLVRMHGLEMTVVSSDLGLRGGPRPVAAYHEFVRHLLDLQFTHAEIRHMLVDNPTKLLNLN